jgi:hypothetical protein
MNLHGEFADGKIKAGLPAPASATSVCAFPKHMGALFFNPKNMADGY